jgi:hypothetical protein
MDNMVRTSSLAREIASQHGILPAQALILVQAAKKELEITTTSWLTLKQAGEIESMIAQDLRN